MLEELLQNSLLKYKVNGKIKMIQIVSASYLYACLYYLHGFFFSSVNVRLNVKE